jgi:hypothetical protein
MFRAERPQKGDTGVRQFVETFGIAEASMDAE